MSVPLTPQRDRLVGLVGPFRHRDQEPTAPAGQIGHRQRVRRVGSCNVLDGVSTILALTRGANRLHSISERTKHVARLIAEYDLVPGVAATTTLHVLYGSVGLGLFAGLGPLSQRFDLLAGSRICHTITRGATVCRVQVKI